MFGKEKYFKNKEVSLSNGCKVSYIDEGDGDTTILFIHGLATYAYSWAANIAQLKDHYRCIAIDLPGNGHSESGDYPYGINFFTGCVYDFMLQLNLKNVVLAGHSMGGQVALNLVINHPTACEKMLLFAPAGFETFNVIERTMYQAGIHFFDFFASEEYSLRETIKSSFYNYPGQIDDMIQELVRLMKKQSVTQYRKMIEGCINGMMNEPVFDKLHTIQQPTLVLFGDNDALIPNKLIHPVSTTSIAKKGTSKMPNARLNILKNCGHFLQLEQPVKVNKLIKDFLG